MTIMFVEHFSFNATAFLHLVEITLGFLLLLKGYKNKGDKSER